MSFTAGEPILRSLQTPGQTLTLGYSDRPKGLPARVWKAVLSPALCVLHAGLQDRPRGLAHGDSARGLACSPLPIGQSAG